MNFLHFCLSKYVFILSLVFKYIFTKYEIFSWECVVFSLSQQFKDVIHSLWFGLFLVRSQKLFLCLFPYNEYFFSGFFKDFLFIFDFPTIWLWCVWYSFLCMFLFGLRWGSFCISEWGFSLNFKKCSHHFLKVVFLPLLSLFSFSHSNHTYAFPETFDYALWRRGIYFWLK